MLRILQILFIGIIVDLYWFSASLNVLPSLNSKKAMAILSLPLLAYHIIQQKKYSVSKPLLFATGFAILYSVINLIAVEVNNTMDFSYANYVTTFFVWLMAAYVAISAIRWGHKKVTITLVTSYLAGVSTIQCFLAFIIDRSLAVKTIVDSIFYSGDGYYDEVNRLYGIGCALDPAGTRFSIVLIMIAFVVSMDLKVRENTKALFGFLFAFLVMSTLGNIISRTTTVGMVLALGAIGMTSGLYRLQLSSKHIKMYRILGYTLLFGIPIFVYLYNNDSYMQEQLRYGFEGFFNWVERGEWTTGSTEKLNSTMWKWPTDTQGWLIGYGSFGLFNFGTDIGYCRLVLYSGIIGFSAFALLFVYNATYFIYKYRRYKYMFVLLLLLSFLIWIKASTDLFMIYALLFCFTDEGEAAYKPVIRLS